MWINICPGTFIRFTYAYESSSFKNLENDLKDKIVMRE